MRRLAMVWLCLFLAFPCVALGSSMLSAQDLQSIQPEFEAFLDALADVLEQRGLLEASQRAEWLAFQLGDYKQNGGYGTIAVMYNPDLLAQTEPDMMLLRLQSAVGEWTLRIDTLRAFYPNLSALPGLPLETTLLTDEGQPVECRFRWYASSGQLFIWNGLAGATEAVGASVITDGQPVYWMDSPIGASQETLTLELLALDSDAVLGQCLLTLEARDQGWILREE